MTFIQKHSNIWNNAVHNGWPAFTFYNGKMYVACRESTGHTAQNGSVRILESIDGGNSFQSIGLIAPPNDPTYPEHGEPVLSVTPDNKLRLFTRSTNSDKSYDSNVWLTTNPSNFGSPITTGLGGLLNSWGGKFAPNEKFYRTVWNHPDLSNDVFKLEESTNNDATSFITKVSELLPNVSTNVYGETGFGFLKDGRMIFVTRNSRIGNDPLTPAGKMGISTDSNYTSFITRDVDRRIEHPEIFVTDDDIVILASRGFGTGGGQRAVDFYTLNISDGTTKILTTFFPTISSDTARPVMIYDSDRKILNVVYYGGDFAGQVDLYFLKISKPFGVL